MIKGTWTEYLRKTVSDILVGRTEYYPPTAFYVALWCNASVTNPNGEVASDSYLRFRIDNDYDNFFEYAEGAKRNRTAITFPTANEDWGIVTHVVVFDGIDKDVTETFDSADVTDDVITLSWQHRGRSELRYGLRGPTCQPASGLEPLTTYRVRSHRVRSSLFPPVEMR